MIENPIRSMYSVRKITPSESGRRGDAAVVGTSAGTMRKEETKIFVTQTPGCNPKFHAVQTDHGLPRYHGFKARYPCFKVACSFFGKIATTKS